MQHVGEERGLHQTSSGCLVEMSVSGLAKATESLGANNAVSRHIFGNGSPNYPTCYL